MLSAWQVLIGAVPIPPTPMDEPPPLKRIVKPPKQARATVAPRYCLRCGEELSRRKRSYCNRDCQYPPAIRAEAVRLYETGMNQTKVAEHLGVSEQLVNDAIKNILGIKYPSALRLKANDDEIVRLKAQGFKHQMIADKIGMSISNVRKRLWQMNGCPSRNSREKNSVDIHRAAVLAVYRPGVPGCGGDAIAHNLKIPPTTVKEIIRQERLRLGLSRNQKIHHKE